MIILRLRGGLGNQLFQIAAGLRLATSLKTPLKLDLSWFRAYSLMHVYGMTPYHFEAEIASDWEIRRYSTPWFPLSLNTRLYYKYHDHIRKRFPTQTPYYLKRLVREQHFHFDSRILNIQHNCILDGFWQSENYFADMKNSVHQNLSLKSPPSAENARLIEQVQKRDSVSVHVRRGDYISNPGINKIHGLCDLDYYQNAISRMNERVPSAHFYFFSDDPDWVEKNLSSKENSTVIRHNGLNQDYEDIRLMSSCKHNIICNSTFSWWGAWLNPYPQKLVLAPHRWFKTNQHNDSDIIPKDWLRVAPL